MNVLLTSCSDGFCTLALRVKWYGEKALLLLGPLFVIVAGILITWVIYIHFVGSIPFYSPYQSLGGIIHLLSSTFISFSIYYNYLMAVISKPGYPPTAKEMGWSDKQVEALKDRHYLNVGFDFKWCKKCQQPKPPRTHHCNICGRCVLKFDHHCPWIANCVGHFNHHYFVLFIFYLWLGCTYAATLSFFPFWVTSDSTQPFSSLVSRGSIVFAFVLSSAVSISLLVMMAWQCFLVFTAQTTLEFYYNTTKYKLAKSTGQTWRNPYDLGIGRNFQEFFGTQNSRFWFYWLVPFLSQPSGDGIAWKTRDQTLKKDVRAGNLDLTLTLLRKFKTY
eukprot:TRINITY_DN8046_c0_g1_i5.p1 TRINITY_DN8046_c0_g1~~TRINITY_DN8046_c0_g1_i5.p1  ORF type:complete len:332 (-),score=41.29 TRINITY_DN8046_c0_g1_i5:195-1190(-)